MKDMQWAFALLLVSLISTANSFSSMHSKLRISPSSSSSLNCAPTPDDIRFAAQFDPSQAVASLSILGSFIVVQSRISKSNELLRVIDTTKKELQSTRAAILSGDQGGPLRKQTLQKKIVDLEEEWMNAITFVSIPGLTLRFRVPQQASQITSLQEIEDSEEAVVSMTSNQNQLSEEKKELTGFDGNVIASTSTQRFLLFVGVFVIAGLFSLLNFLVADPMTSTSSSGGTAGTYRVPSDELFTLPEDAKFQ
jgi:hypothetical protein